MDRFNSARNAEDDAISGEVVAAGQDTDDTTGSAGTSPRAGYPHTYLHKVASARPDSPAAEEDEPTAGSDTDTGAGMPASGTDSAMSDTRAEPAPSGTAPETAGIADVPAAATEPGLIPPGTAVPAEEQRGRHWAEEQRGRHWADGPAGEPASGASGPQGRRPGDEPIPQGLDESLLPGGAGIRERWLGIQARFVDEPRVAVSEAAGIITEVASRLETAVRERRETLRARWDGNNQADTEALRVTMQQYRHLLERLVGI